MLFVKDWKGGEGRDKGREEEEKRRREEEKKVGESLDFRAEPARNTSDTLDRRQTIISHENFISALMKYLHLHSILTV